MKCKVRYILGSLVFEKIPSGMFSFPPQWSINKYMFINMNMWLGRVEPAVWLKGNGQFCRCNDEVCSNTLYAQVMKPLHRRFGEVRIWWGDMRWPTKRQRQRRWRRQIHLEQPYRLLTSEAWPDQQNTLTKTFGVRVKVPTCVEEQMHCLQLNDPFPEWVNTCVLRAPAVVQGPCQT